MYAYLVVFFFVLAQSRAVINADEVARAAADRAMRLQLALIAQEKAEKLEYTMIFDGFCPAGTAITEAAQCKVAARRFKTSGRSWVYKRARSSGSKTGGCYGKNKYKSVYFCTEKGDASADGRSGASASYPYFCLQKKSCSDFECPNNYDLLEDYDELDCLGPDCLDICCEFDGSVSMEDLPKQKPCSEFECPDYYHLKEEYDELDCTYRDCLDTCCEFDGSFSIEDVEEEELATSEDNNHSNYVFVLGGVLVTLNLVFMGIMFYRRKTTTHNFTALLSVDTE